MYYDYDMNHSQKNTVDKPKVGTMKTNILMI